MSEQEPSFTPAPKDERDELVLLEAQLAQKKIEVNANTEFGKYDVAVPNEGEDTYQTYLDQRPTDGVIRDGESFRSTINGKFSSAEAHRTQNGTAQEHYDTLGGILNEHIETPPDLDTLGFAQLAREQSKAEALGDRYTVEQISAAAEHSIMEFATRPGSTWTDEQYQAELVRYNELVGRFSARNVDSDPVVAIAEPSVVNAAPYLSGEDIFQRRQADEAALSESPPTDPEVAVSDAPEVAGVTDPEVVNDPENEINKNTVLHLNGEPVFFERKFADPDGNDIYEVMNADGKLVLVRQDDLTIGELEVRGEVVEKKSARERAKAWWGDKKDVLFSPAYWGARWTNGPAHWLHSRGVTEDMTPEQVDTQRNKNRRNNILGVAAIAVGVVGVTILGVAIHDSLGQPNVDPSIVHDHPISEATPIATELIPTPGPEVVTSDPNFNVPSGGGGIEMFSKLGINEATWYSNDDTLLKQFPGDFYSMGSGSVGIAHPGFLSEVAQDYINTLRR